MHYSVLVLAVFSQLALPTYGSMKYLYDLDVDPYEANNLANELDYRKKLYAMESIIKSWKKEGFKEATLTSTANIHSKFEECGGLCPWLDDDDDYEPIEIEQIYDSSKTNIVLIVVDDWGYNDVGFRSTYMDWTTPNIDRLTDSGIIIDKYFTHSSGQPSRGALLTGRYSSRIGLDYTNSSYYEIELSLSEVTLAQELKSVGYNTYMFGTWHLGFSTTMHLPTNRGFDYFYGHIGNAIDYWSKTNQDGYLDLYEGTELVDDTYALSSDTHIAILLEEKVEEKLIDHYNNYYETPFFLYYSLPLMNGDVGWSAPQKYLDRCSYPDTIGMDATESNDMYNYCALNVLLDDIVGNLTCTLENYGFANDTVIILVSSNGAPDTFAGNNYPFRGNKYDLGRGALSTTAIVHSTRVSETMQGQTYYDTFHVTDWFPSLLFLATDGDWEGSLTGAEIDGSNMWRVINKNGSSSHNEFIHFCDGSTYSAQKNSIKYDFGKDSTHNQKADYEFTSDLSTTGSVLLCEDPSLVAYVENLSDEGYYLYDLSIDPYETVDYSLNSEYAAILAEMQYMADEWQSVVVEAVSPSKGDKKTIWDSCGGVCPWLNDDDGFQAIDVTQKYSYDGAPHVIFVLIDDWGYNDAGYQSTYMKWTTPNIDKLAAEGVKLANYYAHYSCIPSRGALMTGRYAIRLGLWGFHEGAELPLSEATLAQELKSAGYRTSLVGKWHLGCSTEMHLPMNRGFDTYYGYLNGKIDYWNKTYGSFLDLHDGMDLETDEAILDHTLHNAYVLQNKAEYALKYHAEYHSAEPLFLLYSMQLVHDQWTAPDRFLERCSYPNNDTMSDYVQDVEYQYCGMNLMLDEAIANLTCAMETYGFVDNTIMIVVSDNGGESTIQGNNYPFRGSKGSTYRGGVTVQGFIHSKLISDNMKGQSYHGIVHITDWLPTIMGLATNYEWTGSLVDATIDGVDMWETIMNNGTSTHVEIAHYANGEGAASIQYNHYKLELGTTPSGASIVSWVFEEDLKPENSDLSCENVSLMDYASADDAESTAVKDNTLIRNIIKVGLILLVAISFFIIVVIYRISAKKGYNDISKDPGFYDKVGTTPMVVQGTPSRRGNINSTPQSHRKHDLKESKPLL